MWTDKNLTKQQNEFNKKHKWYWTEFEKFSVATKNIISSYKSKDDLNFMAKTPPYLSFSLTYDCNLKCKMCFQYNREKYQDKLTLKDYEKITREIKSWGTNPWITLWGGEPTLHPDFEAIYKSFLDSAGLVAVCTNGTTLHKHFKLLELNNSKTYWLFSIDGLEKTHDEIRGKYTFKKTIKNLENAIKIRNRIGNNHLFNVEITVTNNNLEEIPLLCQHLVSIGVDTIIINHLWYLSKEISDKYINELDDFKEYRLDIEPSSKGYITDQKELPNPLKVFECIEKSSQIIADKALFFTMPIYDLDGIKNHYNINQQWKSKFTCFKNFVKFDFDTIGNVTPCKPFPDFSYGNIKNSSLIEIWKNKHKLQIHERISEKGFSVCNMCPDKALSLPYN